MNQKGLFGRLSGLQGVLTVWFVVLSVVAAGSATMLMNTSVRDDLSEVNDAMRGKAVASVNNWLEHVEHHLLEYAFLTADRQAMIAFASDPSDAEYRQKVLDYFDEIREELQVEFMVVVNAKGERMLVAGPDAIDFNSLLEIVLRDGRLPDTDVVHFERVDGRTAIVAVAPINALGSTQFASRSRQQGILILGYFIDDDFAELVKRMTAVEVAFIDEKGITGHSYEENDAELILKKVQEKVGENNFLILEDQSTKSISLQVNSNHVSFWPIRNGKGDVFGLVAVGIPDIENIAVNSANYKAGLSAFIISVLFAFILALLVSRRLVRPIKSLQHQAHLVGNGQFDAEVKADGYREIESLGKSIENMRSHLREVLKEAQMFGEELETQVEQRTGELAALFASYQAISSFPDVISHLSDILILTCEAMSPANVAIVYLYSPEEDSLRTAACVGVDEAEMSKIRIRPGEGAAGKVYVTKESILFSSDAEFRADLASRESSTREQSERAFLSIGRIESLLYVPLLFRDECLGVLAIANAGQEGEHRIRSAQMLASGISVAIANSKLNRDLEGRIEELKQAQALLLQSEKMASIGQLAAGVAHEINNPIGFINSNLSTLEEYVSDLKVFISRSEEIRQTISSQFNGQVSPLIGELDELKKKLDVDYVLGDLDNLIQESREGSNRVKKIVQDLRTFSRSDTGEIQTASVNSVLDSALNIVWNQLKYNCTVTKDYGQIPDIRCNPNQIGQVFVNILVNAGQAFEKDKHGEIKIRSYYEGNRAFAEITDNGKGISPENLKKIFDPFFTTKPAGQGTGLGLSISYGIIEKHGGHILVNSEVGVGTVITVELPVTSQ